MAPVQKAPSLDLIGQLLAWLPGRTQDQAVANVTGNTLNGYSQKMLKGEFGELPKEISRDRHGRI